MKISFLYFFSFLTLTSMAQNPEEAEKLVDEGVAYHDKGDFEGAIARYDKALKADKNNVYALAEKAMSNMGLKKYDEAISLCKLAIESNAGHKALKSVYVTYGTAYDNLKKIDQSLEVYDEGIKQFPDFYQLYFNKGITLSGVRKYDEALLCFQKSAFLNPKHGSSHNAIARLLEVQENRIPAILAYSRFLAVEAEGQRAQGNLGRLKSLMGANVEKTGKKSITVNVSSKNLDSETKKKENNFSSSDLFLSLDAALDYDEKNTKKTEIELFERKLANLAAHLKETAKDNYGFYWKYYVPYFVEMKEKNLVEVFSHIAFYNKGEEDNIKWIKQHSEDLDKFYEWSKNFSWKAE